MSTGAKKLPGALRRALFQDVPYVLDSLWRHAEFNLNRIGAVDYEKTRELLLRPAWMCGAFVLYVFVSVFAVFGPTLDAMCSVDSTDFALTFRMVVIVLLVFAAVAMFFATLNSATFRLAYKGQCLAEEACEKDEALRARRNRVTAAAAAEAQKTGAVVGSFLGVTAEKIVGNLVRLFTSFPFLKGSDIRALIFAFVVLVLGTALVILPLVAAVYALYNVEVDAQSCVQSVNENLVHAQLFALLILLAGGVAAWQRWGKNDAFAVFGAAFAMLALVIGVLWWKFSAADGSEAAGGFYPHVYVIVIGTLLAIALAARPFAWLMFRRLAPETAGKFRAALDSEDLLQNQRDPPEVSALRLWSAFVSGVSGHLLHFLLLPAFVAFIAPTNWLYWYTFGFALVSLVLLMYGSLSSRWEQMLLYIDRWFLVGTPLVISMLVIVIGMARLAGVQYVATVIDATPIGVLFIIVVMLYVAVWFFEYWINRWLGEELIKVVSDRNRARLGFAPCAFVAAGREIGAKEDGRYLALHGTGRFCAHGWYEHANPRYGEAPRGLSFTTYGFLEFFNTLGEKPDIGEDPPREIRRRVVLYFNVLNLSLVLAVGLLIAWHLDWSRPLAVTPMVDVVAPKSTPLSELTRTPATKANDPLADRLISQAKAGRPSLVVAASGGGTRAAVYTAVALEGIAQIERARDVVLLSGVSGGGVSAAVFASRYDDLTTSSPGKPAPGKTDAWADYVDSMAQPFIQDVLEGIGELRIVGSTSLGALLQESLQRRAFKTGAQRMADVKTPALILNTAISGHPYDDSEVLQGRVSSPRTGARCTRKSRPYANLAGGRLIFTNIRNTSRFPQRSADAPDMWLPYRIINFGDVNLSSAAALTANFPPVFSNARVRIRPDAEDKQKGACPQSYFVTDGGATENLGLVSALYALRSTLADLPDDSMPGFQKISDIHILALEASAIDYDYSDDRGVGAATGGSKERINAQLTQRLLEDVRAQATRLKANLVVHYLPLPVAFRSRGGFGTHWMFAPSVRVGNPHLPDKPDDSILPWVTPRGQETLNRREVMLTLRAMFDPDDPICQRSDRVFKELANPANASYVAADWPANVQRVARWICGHDDEGRPDAPKPDFQVDAWKGVVAALRPAPVTAAN